MWRVNAGRGEGDGFGFGFQNANSSPTHLPLQQGDTVCASVAIAGVELTTH